MWNGNFGRIEIVLLPVLVALGGCESRAAPLHEATAVAERSDPRSDRHQVDVVRNRVWVLSESGVVLYSNTRRERVVIALPEWFWAGAPYGCPPNLALGPKGEAIVTSDVVPTLWRIDPETFAVTVHRLELDADTDKDVGFSELAYSSRHGKYFAVSARDGATWSVDASLGKAQKVPASARSADSCGSKL
jgi:hypothetical protein